VSLAKWSYEAADDYSSVSVLAANAHGEIAGGSDEGTVQIWHSVTGNAIGCIKKRDKQRVMVTALAYISKKLAVGYQDGSMYLWDPASEDVFTHLKEHGSAVNDIAISADQNKLMAGSDDGVVSIWDVRTAAQTQQLTGIESNAKTISCSGNSLIATGHEDGTVAMWDTRTGKAELKSDQHRDAIKSVDCRHDGAEIVSADQKVIRFWQLRKASTEPKM